MNLTFNLLYPHVYKKKARYAFNQGLAGLVIYRIDIDDFLPECSNVRYPLLRAIHSEFNSEFKANSNDKPGDQKLTIGRG
jgi:hypothetical protein